jgi:hypothetical protein
MSQCGHNQSLAVTSKFASKRSLRVQRSLVTELSRSISRAVRCHCEVVPWLVPVGRVQTRQLREMLRLYPTPLPDIESGETAYSTRFETDSANVE